MFETRKTTNIYRIRWNKLICQSEHDLNRLKSLKSSSQCVLFMIFFMKVLCWHDIIKVSSFSIILITWDYFGRRISEFFTILVIMLLLWTEYLCLPKIHIPNMMEFGLGDFRKKLHLNSHGGGAPKMKSWEWSPSWWELVSL